MKWIGQHIVDSIAKFRSAVDFSEDVTFYQPVNDANPKISIGSSDDERLAILVNYKGTTTQEAQIALFKTFTESTTAHDGKFIFAVDEVNILQFRDDGINLLENMGIAINGTPILTDSSGTATLSNIDSLDSTTQTLILSLTNDAAISPSSIYNVALKVGRDTDNLIDFGTTDNNIKLVVNGAEQLNFMDGVIKPRSTNDIDLGTSDVEFKDAYFDGVVTSDSFVGPLTGQADTVATIAGLAPNTATTQATQPNIESIGTDGDTLAILSDTILVSNATASKSQIKLVNTADDATGPRLTFWNTRTDSSIQDGEDNDIVGQLDFWSYDDGTPTSQIYAKIYTDIHDATAGEESGRLTLQVANHDGELGSGLIITGGSANDEIDVTVGLGANSVVTIPGAIQPATVIASAYLDADTMHYSAQRQLTHHTFQDQIWVSGAAATQVVYISLTEIDAENTNGANFKLPLTAPVAGKLLKAFIRTSHDLSDADLTLKLCTRTVSQTSNGIPTEIGAITATGPNNKLMATFDFTGTLDGDTGTNAIAAGDKVQISIEASADETPNSNFFVTLLWEWDLS